MTKPHILIVEDDPQLSELLCEQLTSSGYLTSQCFDGASGLLRASQEAFQLILLDVLLPKMDGMQLLSKLRLQRRTPVIMLTARGAEQDRISGFRCGADDYLPKPFNFTELLLRIEAVLRRSSDSSAPSRQQAEMDIGCLKLLKSTQQALLQGQPLNLTGREFQLLWLLAQSPEHPVNKAELYQQLMQRPYSRYDRSLDMHVSNLRRKLKQSAIDDISVRTVHGKGYLLHHQSASH